MEILYLWVVREAFDSIIVSPNSPYDLSLVRVPNRPAPPPPTPRGIIILPHPGLKWELPNNIMQLVFVSLRYESIIRMPPEIEIELTDPNWIYSIDNTKSIFIFYTGIPENAGQYQGRTLHCGNPTVLPSHEQHDRYNLSFDCTVI